MWTDSGRIDGFALESKDRSARLFLAIFIEDPNRDRRDGHQAILLACVEDSHLGYTVVFSNAKGSSNSSDRSNATGREERNPDVLGGHEAYVEPDRRRPSYIGERRYHPTFERSSWTKKVISDLHLYCHGSQWLVWDPPVKAEGFLEGCPDLRGSAGSHENTKVPESITVPPSWSSVLNRADLSSTQIEIVSLSPG